tara:strand:- start:2287 stop:5061 length:2775 start_codon:yes stop_codon:yes gene_type:complete
MATEPTRTLRYSEVKIDNFGGGITDRYIASDLSKYKTADNLIISNVGPTTRPTLKVRPGFRGYCFDKANTAESALSDFSMNSTYPFMGVLKDDTYLASDSLFYRLEDEIENSASSEASIVANRIVMTAHGLTDNRLCYVVGSNLPTGISEKTTYRINYVDANNIELYSYDVEAHTDAGSLVTLTPSTVNSTFKVIQKAYMKEITKTQTGSIFNSMGNLYPVSFSMRTNQLLAVARNSSALEKPVRIYQKCDDDGSNPVYIVEGMELPNCYDAVDTPLVEWGSATAADFGKIAGEGAAPDKAYQYAVCFTRRFNIKTETGVVKRKQFGRVSYSKTINMEDPGTDSVTVTLPGIPDDFEVMQNPYTPGSTLVVELYRTVNGGTEFFKVGSDTATEFNNNTISDTVSDANLVMNTPLYTSGGYLNHHNPPPCKYMTTVGNLTYYGYVQETVDGTDFEKPERVMQSIPGTSGEVGSSSYVDVDDTIVGLGQAGAFPMVFTETYVYRIEGKIDSFGVGSVRVKAVSEHVGCASNEAIVSTQQGVYWMGNDGFYFSDGYQLVELTTGLKESFDELVNKSKAVATYDKTNNMVYWGVCDNASITENNHMWVLNTKTGGFTKATSKKDDLDIVSIIEKNGSIYRSDTSGYVYKHHEDIKKDTIRSVTAGEQDFTTWNNTHIPFEYLSSATDFGTAGVRKWVKDATITVKSNTNIGIMPYSNNDDSARVRDMKEIRELGTVLWGSETFVWGNPDIEWRTPETVSNVRRFPRSSMRCRRKQIGLKPAPISVLRSDIYGGDALVSVIQDPSDATLYTITLNPLKTDGLTANTVIWPTADFLFESQLCFPETATQYSETSTEYTHELEFVSRTSDSVIIVQGGTLTGLAAGTYDRKWVLKVYQKDQEIELTGINIRFAPMSNAYDRYQSEEEGVNE